MGCSPWGRKESDTTEQLTTATTLSSMSGWSLIHSAHSFT